MKPAAARVLMVDDDEGVRFGVRDFLELHGYQVEEAADCRQAVDVFRASVCDITIIDHGLPDGDAIALIARLKAIDANVAPVVLTGHGSIDLAVRAMQAGAEHFLVKPVNLHSLKAVLDRLVEQLRCRKTGLAARNQRQRDALDPFIGSSPAIRRLADDAHRVLAATSPVLIRGETGSGKGVLARWLHANGPRADEALVDLNCAGLSRELLESELFGHARGAFTGAVAVKQGLLELAHRGTVFLDEIGDMPQDVQPRLLKVLEEQRFRRLGETSERSVDVRLIAASHHDLAALTRSQQFRSDLYYRLNSLPLLVPPLRERPQDIVPLAEHLLARLQPQVGRQGVTLSDEACQALLQHDWPGNLRELQNVLERALLLGEQAALSRRDLRLGEPADHHAGLPGVPGPPGAPGDADLTLEAVERHHILRVLAGAGGRVDAAAERLAIPRSTLYQKLKQYRAAGH